MSASRQPAEVLKELLSAQPLPGCRVLLYGGGDAALAVWLAAAGAEVAVLDASRDAVIRVLEQTRQAGVERRVRGVESASTQLSMFADVAFDLLVLSPGAPYELSELARILRPGARLVSAVPLDEPSARPLFTSLRPYPSSARFRLPWFRPAPLFWTSRRRSDS